MRKSELIKKITAKQESLSSADIALGVSQILQHLVDAISLKGRIEIRDFGNFTLHYQPSKEAHNPKTCEKVQVPGKYKIRFKMGKGLKERLNKAMPLKD